MQEKEIEHFEQELKRIREWTIDAEENLNLIRNYSLPIVSPMLDLAPPDLPQNVWMWSIFGWQLEDNPNHRLYPVKRDVIVLKRSDSLAKEMNNEINKDIGEPSCLPYNKISIDLHKVDNKSSSEVLKNSETVSNSPVQKPSKKKRGRKKKEASSVRSDKQGHIPILEKLKQHPCSTEHTYNPITKRMNKVITCLYEGCGKQFTKTWNILDHFKVHTGEKPFRCEACKRAFSQKGNLTKHLKLHVKCARYIDQLRKSEAAMIK